MSLALVAGEHLGGPLLIPGVHRFVTTLLQGLLQLASFGVVLDLGIFGSSVATRRLSLRHGATTLTLVHTDAVVRASSDQSKQGKNCDGAKRLHGSSLAALISDRTQTPQHAGTR
jgi:hypothetical protein